MSSGFPVTSAEKPLDVVVIGAGFAGMYLLHRLRGAGFRVKAIEGGPEV